MLQLALFVYLIIVEMKTKLIFPALLLAVCVLFPQCRAKSDVSSVQNVAGAVDVAAVDTVAAEKDTPVVVASVPEDTVAVAPVPEVQAVNPVPQGEPHPGFVYLRSLIPDLIEELRYFTTNNFMGVKVDGYEANLAILRPRRWPARPMNCGRRAM